MHPQSPVQEYAYTNGHDTKGMNYRMICGMYRNYAKLYDFFSSH
jgi:hypothetical protein